MCRAFTDSGSGVGVCRRGRLEKQTESGFHQVSLLTHTPLVQGLKESTLRAAVAGRRGQ